VAAIKYLQELNNTEAQASGLLVIASYNWGENNIRQIINRMPENPRERNFWRLLSYKDIPRETYDYVFSIFSAAVICENQSLFRFKGDCPEIPTSK
jgi:membrane-bound lytic murein transglycosylase D